MLTTLDDPIKKQRLIAFDTEDDSCGNVTEIDFAWYDHGKRRHYMTTNLDSAIKWIYQQPKSTFVAHNLEYDVNNLFRDSNYKNVDSISYTARIVRMSLVRCGHTFFDSFNWFAGSLAKMASTVGMEKTKLDPHSIEYVQNDTNILLEWITKFQDTLNNELGVNLKATIGSIAMAVYRTKFLDHPVIGYNNPECLDGYYGGRCELFYHGKIKGPIHIVDINSAYMYAMCKTFPDPESIEEGKSYLDTEFGFGKFEVNAPKIFIPKLPIHYKKKLVFPVGKFSGTWTFHEIRYALKFGYEVKQLSGYGTNKGEQYFKRYDDYFYARRLEAKAVKDAFGDKFYKGLGVNLYGKLVQHKPRIEARTTPFGEDTIEKVKAHLSHVLGPFYMYEIPMLEPPPTACYLWGIYVTAFCRIHLDGILQTIHDSGDTLLYCDTDSGMFCGNNCISKLDLDEDRLGALKLEHYTEANYIMPKGYIMQPRKEYNKHGTRWNHGKIHCNGRTAICRPKPKAKVACKGISAPKDLNDDDFATRLNPQVAFMQGEKSFTHKPYRMRQALVQKKKPNFWDDFPKQRKGEYDRRLGNDGPTEPITLQEW